MFNVGDKVILTGLKDGCGMKKCKNCLSGHEDAYFNIEEIEGGRGRTILIRGNKSKVLCSVNPLDLSLYLGERITSWRSMLQ
jgi:D-arabinose 1-dehydrogenase-like Zn-dependent alcohol dehydrogenase